MILYMTNNKYRVLLKEDDQWHYPKDVTSDQMSYYFNEGSEYVYNSEVGRVECVNCGQVPERTHDGSPWWSSHKCPPEEG